LTFVTQSSVVAAFDLFAESAALTFVWADCDLKVSGSYGVLADTITSGASLTSCLPILFGLEPDIVRLIDTPGDTLELPNVSLELGGKSQPRLNLCVRWDESSALFVVLVSRALSRAALEVELQRQVRARQHAERELVAQADSIRKTNDVLARVNRDLKEFAHVVSHDLKAPMRALRYFADDLENALDNPDADDPRQHLDRLRGQSQRMTRMLSGLLAYAKLDQKQDAAEQVATGPLTELIVASLPVSEGVSVQITGDWPVIETIPALLDLVLRNLIENALRYASPTDGWVCVHCEPGTDVLHISVTDNGPGIAPCHQEAIFNPFTRLPGDHSGDTQDPDSAGMGLALVMRAIDAVGGAITVQSDPGRAPGTCFQLVWPRIIRAIS